MAKNAHKVSDKEGHGREFMAKKNDGLKMIEFYKLWQVNRCEDRDIIIVTLSSIFVYNKL